MEFKFKKRSISENFVVNCIIIKKEKTMHFASNMFNHVGAKHAEIVSGEAIILITAAAPLSDRTPAPT